MANENTRGPQSRAWCFTFNNYTEGDYELLKKKFNELKNVEYWVIGKEVGAQGTPHLQGYIRLSQSRRLSFLKNQFNIKIHWETRKGTDEQAAVYCKKDGKFEEHGTPAKQGTRNDLNAIKSAVKDGKPMREIIELCNPRNLRYAEKYLQLSERKRNWKPEVTWIYGPTGTGKSKMAHEMFAGTDFYRKAKGTKWWDGYDAHENVIIDDFRDSWWSLTEMLDLLDRYDTVVECKGGSRQFLAKRIIITSAFDPANCYKSTGEAVNQLLRRIDNTVFLKDTLVVQMPTERAPYVDSEVNDPDAEVIKRALNAPEPSECAKNASYVTRGGDAEVRGVILDPLTPPMEDNIADDIEDVPKEKTPFEKIEELRKIYCAEEIGIRIQPANKDENDRKEALKRKAEINAEVAKLRSLIKNAS